MSLSRRRFLSSFLKGAGCFAVAATAPVPPTVFARSTRPGGASARYQFPQGLASGDPLPDAVMLWTRVVALDDAPEKPSDPISLTLQVSRGETFATVLVERTVAAPRESDGTVRMFVDGLEPGMTYFYRFTAPDGTRPRHVGRTRTAPAPTDDATIRLAVASCQAYEAGHYGAYRWLIEQDASEEVRKDKSGDIDAVLHLGDFIYEALGYGGARTVPDLPDGGHHGEDGTGQHARTLADYRHLYKVYLSDPDLQAARARFPFINIWDDHEFTNDAWQSAATYDGGREPAQQRKVAANRAWFEFIPAVLSEHPGSAGQASHARDFADADVNDAPLSPETREGLHPDASNRAAVGSLTIYRSFRWGKHLELTLTDTRSYRSPHPVPPEINRQIAGTDRYLTPLRAVEVFDAGRTYDNGNPPKTLSFGEHEVTNVRRTHAPGTMLGARQKAWWKATMQASDATWNVWGHSVPTLPIRLDLGTVDPDAETVVFTTDTWDGYLTERAELMDFLDTQEIVNVVSLSGDNHNSFAGVVCRTYDHPDGDAAASDAIGAEFSVCGISSPSVFQALVQAVDDDSPLRPLITHDARSAGGGEQEETLNLTFLHGAQAAATAAKTGRLDQALAAANDAQNPHLRYVDSNAYGLAIVTIDADGVDAEFVTMPPPVDVPRTETPVPLRRTRFHLAARLPGAPVDLEGPDVEGRLPYPLSVMQATE